MSKKRLDLRLDEEDVKVLEEYCDRTGATKTGTIRMVLRVLKSPKVLAIVSKLASSD